MKKHNNYDLSEDLCDYCNKKCELYEKYVYKVNGDYKNVYMGHKDCMNTLIKELKEDQIKN